MDIEKTKRIKEYINIFTQDLDAMTRTRILQYGVRAYHEGLNTITKGTFMWASQHSKKDKYKRSLEIRKKISETRKNKYPSKGLKRNSRAYRQIVENFIGRKLKNNEVIHHRDNNPLNNDVSNLQVMDSKKHQLLHRKEQEYLNQKLTKEDCLFIVENTEINYKKLAKMFNISPSYIYEIRRKFKEGRLIWQIL